MRKFLFITSFGLLLSSFIVSCGGSQSNEDGFITITYETGIDSYDYSFEILMGESAFLDYPENGTDKVKYWIDKETGETVDDTALLEKDTILIPKREKFAYSVYFDTLDENTSFYNYVPFGERVSEPSVYKDDYDIEGWYFNEEKWNFDNVVKQDMTLTAKWLKMVNTIYFDPNGGTCDVESKEVHHYASIGDLPTPTKEGYVFVGWFYGDVEIYGSTSWEYYEDIVVKAVWAKEKITVNFDFPEIGEFDPVVINYGWSYELPYIRKDGKEVAWYLNDELIPTSSTWFYSTDDVILTGKWVEAESNIHFYLEERMNGGELDSLDSIKLCLGDQTKFEIPSTLPDGELFYGWAYKGNVLTDAEGNMLKPWDIDIREVILYPVVGKAINTPDEFLNIASNLDGNYVITSDLDFSGYDINPIGSLDDPFTGRLFGNGHTLSNINISETNNISVGLFSCIAGDKTYVENFNIKNINIDLSYNNFMFDDSNNFSSKLSAFALVGGLAGHATGTFNNINLTDCLIDVNFGENLLIEEDAYSFESYFGGIFGGAGITDFNCLSTSGSFYLNVNGELFDMYSGYEGLSYGSFYGGFTSNVFHNELNNCSSNASIRAEIEPCFDSYYIGGFAGNCQESTINYCNFTGYLNVSKTTNDESFSEICAGGFFGSLSSANITNCISKSSIFASRLFKTGKCGGFVGRCYGELNVNSSFSDSYVEMKLKRYELNNYSNDSYNYAGGFAGCAGHCNIQNAYVEGNITCDIEYINETTGNASGFIGILYGGGQIKNSYINIVRISASSAVAGITILSNSVNSSNLIVENCLVNVKYDIRTNDKYSETVLIGEYSEADIYKPSEVYFNGEIYVNNVSVETINNLLPENLDSYDFFKNVISFDEEIWDLSDLDLYNYKMPKLKGLSSTNENLIS